MGAPSQSRARAAATAAMATAAAVLLLLLPAATAFVVRPGASSRSHSSHSSPSSHSSHSRSSMAMTAAAPESSDRREALGLLLGGATGVAAAAVLLGAPSSTLAAPAAATAAMTTTVVAKATKKAPLAPYPAKVTSKCYIDVRITGFVTGEEKATNEEYVGRIVIGLFGDDAPLAVREFLKYVSVPYGGDAPSYAYSSFIKADPGVAVTAGRIKGVKEIELAGSKEFEWFDRVLGAQGLDEPKPTLRHDRKGLLTKAREQDAVDPVFDITLGPTPERDGRATVFGIVLEGMEALDEVGATPVYTTEAAGPQPEALDRVFAEQKSLFLKLAKTFGDERAVDRRGAFLKRVEVIGCGVL